MGSQVVQVELKIVDNLTGKSEEIAREFGADMKSMAGSVAELDNAVKINWGTTQSYTRSMEQLTGALRTSSDAEKESAQLAKTSAAMRKAAQEEAAASAVKSAESEATEMARIQARAEAEFQKVNAQAAAAEAQANASRIMRAIEKETAFHQTRLEALAGNDAAQEAEARRHAAVMLTLQEDAARKSTMASQQMFARVGSLGNQIQAIQGAFFGVSMAVGETDGKFGQMVGRMGAVTSGALGMAQAYQIASAEMAGMSRAMLVGMPILGAVGIALALVLDHQAKLKELAKHNDWLGDPAKASAVAAAMDQAAKAQDAATISIVRGASSYGVYAGMLNSTNRAAADFAEANIRIQSITGMTSDELIKLYGSLDKARWAFQQLADERLVNQQFALERAVIGAKKDGLDKAVALQEVSNRQAEESIKDHYAAILLDTHKSSDERKRAMEQMGKELALQEQVNQAELAD